MPEDLFDSLFTLEDSLYDEGYRQGEADGARAGRLEGRVFGIEKGFEKYQVMGMLHGRATVLRARLAAGRSSAGSGAISDEGAAVEVSHDQQSSLPGNAPSPLQPSARLEKHIQTLLALVDPATLSLDNTEDAVSAFDDRLKRARAKMRVIESIVGEGGTDERGAEKTRDGGKTVAATSRFGGEENIEDIRSAPIRP